MDARVEATQERLPDGRQAPSGVAFLFGYFLFTPGILPSTLRAGFAVRMRSCACVATQRESNSAAEGRLKLLLSNAVAPSKSITRERAPTVAFGVCRDE